MTKYKFEYIGLIEIDAKDEDDAHTKFGLIPNEELGKLVHTAEILEPDNICHLCDAPINESDDYCQACINTHEHEFEISDMDDDFIRHTCDICKVEYMEKRH